ncbi:MAG: UvrB/UvrC motif-containing protein, partial [Neobacillus sp.]
NCSNPAKKNTACLNHSLGLCIGMCKGGSTVVQYNSIIKNIIGLLNRTDMSILDEMNQKMLNTSAKFDFETAAKYRDYIDAISTLIKKEKVIEFTEENKNIVIIESLNDDTIKLFLIKGNKILFSEKYLLNDLKQLCALMKTAILNFFKTEVRNLSERVGKDDIDEAQIIFSYLTGSTCKYAIIPETWLDPEMGTNIDESINKLLKEVASSNHETHTTDPHL